MISIDNGYRISIMLTEACNLNCSHCYMSANKSGKSLTIQEIDLLIKGLPDNCLRISITGGEPYMCKDKLYYIIDKIVQRFKGKKPEIRVETNGTFFDQNEESIRNEVLQLISHGVDTLRLSDDKFHEDGGLNIDKLRYIEKVVKNYNLNIVVSTLVQENAVAFGRAKKLEDKYQDKKMCLNKKESIIISFTF